MPSDILEVRVCSQDGINIRKGPGTNFEKDESGQLFEGEKLYVLGERDGWIHFRVTVEDIGWSGWVKKNYTVFASSDQKNQQDEIQLLKETGLLVSINPQINEAFVMPEIWNKLDYQTKENIGRVLAFYCGKEKGTGLNWVEIKDNHSGKKLAKYSESWGFKVY